MITCDKTEQQKQQSQVNQQERDLMLSALSCPCGEHLMDSFCAVYSKYNKYNEYESKTRNSSEDVYNVTQNHEWHKRRL